MQLSHTPKAPKLTSEAQSRVAPTNPSVIRTVVKLSTIISALIASACHVNLENPEPELVSSSAIIEPKKPLEPKKAKVEKNRYARLVGHSKLYPRVQYPNSFDEIEMRQKIYDRAVAQEEAGMDNPDYDPELAAWLWREREIASENARTFNDEMRHQEQWDKNHQDD